MHLLALIWMWRTWPSPLINVDTRPRRETEVRLIPFAVQVKQQARVPQTVVHHSQPAVPTHATLKLKQIPRLASAKSTPIAQIATEIPSLTEASLLPDSARTRQDAIGSEATAPTFDITSALATARQIAREDDKNRKPVFGPTPGSHIQDKLERARRTDCRTINAQSINLLANAVVAATHIVKNAIDNSGCKW